jgi:hypothetical protein
MARHSRVRRRRGQDTPGLGIDEPAGADAAGAATPVPEASGAPAPSPDEPAAGPDPGDGAPAPERTDLAEGDPASGEALPDPGGVEADAGSALAAEPSDGDGAADTTTGEEVPGSGVPEPAPEAGAPDAPPSSDAVNEADEGSPAGAAPAEGPGPWLSALVAGVTGAIVTVVLLAAGHVIHL